MPRGRKPRASQIHTPPCGFYRSYMGILDAVREGRVSPQAGHLWQIIQAHSFGEGFCAMTDVELGRHMGGMTRQQVANLRASLRAAGLLKEVTGPPGSNERRLVSLCGSEGPTGSGIDAVAISRQSHLTPNDQEEEELINLSEQDEITTPLPPNIRVRVVTMTPRARDGVFDAEGVSRQTELTPNRFTVNTAAVQALAQYMIARGVFPRIAAELAPKFLARQELADAKAEVMAWWFSVTEGEDIRGVEDGDDERLRGRLVTRLKAAADGGISPPLRALGRALDVMREFEEAAAGARDDDESCEDEGWAGSEDDEIEDARQEDALPVDGSEDVEAGFEAPDLPLALPGCPTQLTGTEAWGIALKQLREQIGWKAYDSYLTGSRFARLETGAGRPQMVIQVAQGFVAAWLNQNATVRAAVSRKLRLILNIDIDIRFEGA
jgi:hypothetical protein